MVGDVTTSSSRSSSSRLFSALVFVSSKSCRGFGATGLDMSCGSIAKAGERSPFAFVPPELVRSFGKEKKSQGTAVTGGGTGGSGLTKSSSREKLNQSDGFCSDITGRGENRGVDRDGEGSRESEVAEVWEVKRSKLTKSDRSLGLRGEEGWCKRLFTSMISGCKGKEIWARRCCGDKQMVDKVRVVAQSTLPKPRLKFSLSLTQFPRLTMSVSSRTQPTKFRSVCVSASYKFILHSRDR